MLYCLWKRPVKRKIISLILSIAAAAIILSGSGGDPRYPWLGNYLKENALKERIPAPEGFRRIDLPEGHFGLWLRGLPLKKKGSPVRLYNKRLKARQDIHYAVIDIDTGKRDLQQCADAVIRLRTEFLWSEERFDEIGFNFVSGFYASYERWREGCRIRMEGSKLKEERTAGYDGTHECFRKYLDAVFTYANTYSLKKELASSYIRTVMPGDVLICGRASGYCHAVIVMDVAENDVGKRRFILAQSYMPAQDIHILKVPGSDDCWYEIPEGDILSTPEWDFGIDEIKRFREK